MPTATEIKTKKLLLQRASRYLLRVIEELSPTAAEHALIAPNDAVALIEIASSPALIEKAVTDDPLADARMRGRKAAEALLQREGGCGTVATAMEALGISKPGVEKRRAAGKLIAIDTGRRGLLYPRWQFKKEKYGVLDGLEAVLQKLRQQGCAGWSIVSFFLNPNLDLDGKSPLQALRKGKLEGVLFAAGNYGEMGR